MERHELNESTREEVEGLPAPIPDPLAPPLEIEASYEETAPAESSAPADSLRLPQLEDLPAPPTSLSSPQFEDLKNFFANSETLQKLPSKCLEKTQELFNEPSVRQLREELYLALPDKVKEVHAEITDAYGTGGVIKLIEIACRLSIPVVRQLAQKLVDWCRWLADHREEIASSVAGGYLAVRNIILQLQYRLMTEIMRNAQTLNLLNLEKHDVPYPFSPAASEGFGISLLETASQPPASYGFPSSGCAFESRTSTATSATSNYDDSAEGAASPSASLKSSQSEEGAQGDSQVLPQGFRLSAFVLFQFFRPEGAHTPPALASPFYTSQYPIAFPAVSVMPVNGNAHILQYSANSANLTMLSTAETTVGSYAPIQYRGIPPCVSYGPALLKDAGVSRASSADGGKSGLPHQRLGHDEVFKPRVAPRPTRKGATATSIVTSRTSESLVMFDMMPN
ncbi:hypothetical protein BESB_018180 [Besnoitia besnoiti]|uniref:Uncharacterized protein n=1 Tax=Besnoitia besnoiti TaxID=94643 RepID=A0A2A9MAU8_BESBE|nr:hypothetical protein BESB_018180 [Besnoitia besnoiti]PFH32500.1 hypothetical protein BESB_018180 [Besnoitia besnoiti]